MEHRSNVSWTNTQSRLTCKLKQSISVVSEKDRPFWNNQRLDRVTLPSDRVRHFEVFLYIQHAASTRAIRHEMNTTLQDQICRVTPQRSIFDALNLLRCYRKVHYCAVDMYKYQIYIRIYISGSTNPWPFPRGIHTGITMRTHWSSILQHSTLCEITGFWCISSTDGCKSDDRLFYPSLDFYKTDKQWQHIVEYKSLHLITVYTGSSMNALHNAWRLNATGLLSSTYRWSLAMWLRMVQLHSNPNTWCLPSSMHCNCVPGRRLAGIQSHMMSSAHTRPKNAQCLSVCLPQWQLTIFKHKWGWDTLKVKHPDQTSDCCVGKSCRWVYVCVYVCLVSLVGRWDMCCMHEVNHPTSQRWAGHCISIWGGAIVPDSGWFVIFMSPFIIDRA